MGVANAGLAYNIRRRNVLRLDLRNVKEKPTTKCHSWSKTAKAASLPGEPITPPPKGVKTALYMGSD